MVLDNPVCPTEITEFADQLVDYVERALGVRLGYDSDTLPVLDHYVKQVPEQPGGARTLVIVTAGAYYGEVVRQRMGGSWVRVDPDSDLGWRLVLPGGLSFSPAAFVAEAMAGGEVDLADASFDAPPRTRSIFEAALERMAPVSEHEYYSLPCRFDTIEHLQEVIVARMEELEREREANERGAN
jgi:hypothetical protein